ncbi:hypothetical protein DVH24_014584 [Malus domestica]|uniref:O-methyltransferase C-terminal domain-containing protein n=1 Tax=Malus domestica TaxID=3750 RepID=A0A498KJV3_MALDO|nr:hypothetical protein DVH24_014584 [Malus domestica]
MQHRMHFWNLGAQEPRFGNLFNEAMEADSKLIERAVVEECGGVFEGLKSLGEQEPWPRLANAFPNINCIVFDQPDVVAELQGTTHNLGFVGGDIFVEIQPAILLKNHIMEQSRASVSIVVTSMWIITERQGSLKVNLEIQKKKKKPTRLLSPPTPSLPSPTRTLPFLRSEVLTRHSDLLTQLFSLHHAQLSALSNVRSSVAALQSSLRHTRSELFDPLTLTI